MGAGKGADGVGGLGEGQDGGVGEAITLVRNTGNIQA